MKWHFAKVLVYPSWKSEHPKDNGQHQYSFIKPYAFEKLAHYLRTGEICD